MDSFLVLLLFQVFALLVHGQDQQSSSKSVTTTVAKDTLDKLLTDQAQVEELSKEADLFRNWRLIQENMRKSKVKVPQRPQTILPPVTPEIRRRIQKRKRIVGGQKKQTWRRMFKKFWKWLRNTQESKKSKSRRKQRRRKGSRRKQRPRRPSSPSNKAPTSTSALTPDQLRKNRELLRQTLMNLRRFGATGL